MQKIPYPVRQIPKHMKLLQSQTTEKVSHEIEHW